MVLIITHNPITNFASDTAAKRFAHKKMDGAYLPRTELVLVRGSRRALRRKFRKT